jgi:hypothetical protein
MKGNMIDEDLIEEIKDKERKLNACSPTGPSTINFRRRPLKKRLKKALDEYGDEARFELFDIVGGTLSKDHYENEINTIEHILTGVIADRYGVSGVFEMQEYIFNKFVQKIEDEKIIAKTLGKLKTKSLKCGGTFFLTDYRLFGTGFSIFRDHFIPGLGIFSIASLISEINKENSFNKQIAMSEAIFEDSLQYGTVFPIYGVSDFSEKKGKIKWVIEVEKTFRTKKYKYKLDTNRKAKLGNFSRDVLKVVKLKMDKDEFQEMNDIFVKKLLEKFNEYKDFKGFETEEEPSN